MRSSFLNRLFARSKIAGYGGGRMLMSTMSKATPPWLMLPPHRVTSGDIVFNFYSLKEKINLSFSGGFPYDANKMRFVGSSHGWLALFNRRTNDLFLTNPISGRRIDLPPTNNIVSRVVLSCSPDDNDCRAVMSSVPIPRFYCRTLHRYLPSMNLGPAQSLAFCWPQPHEGSAYGSPYSNWTPISTGDCERACGDFVYSRKKELLFCLTTNYIDPKFGFDDTRMPNLSDLEVWDLSNPEVPRIERRHSMKEMPRLVRDSSTGMSERRYLVFSEQTDQLYLIRRHMMERVDDDGNSVEHIYYHNRRGWDKSYPYKTVGFDIHRIDEDGTLLMDEKVSLDNVAIFIGINHGLVMKATEDMNSNSIYFTDDTIHTPPNECDVDGKMWDWLESRWAESHSVYGGHDIGIFDCKKKTISPCFYPIDPPSLKRIHPPPLWFTPHDYIL